MREYKEQVEMAPLLKKVLDGELLEESEWREIGVTQRFEDLTLESADRDVLICS